MEHINSPNDTQRVRSIKLGRGGNPRARPNDSGDRARLGIETLIDDASEALTRKLIEKALGGDMGALRVCFEWLLSRQRDCAVTFALPPIATAADAQGASAAVLEACANGRLTPREAAMFMDLIEAHVQTIGAAEIEARLSALEEAKAKL
jgi:hypothetical protein